MKKILVLLFVGCSLMSCKKDDVQPTPRHIVFRFTQGCGVYSVTSVTPYATEHRRMTDSTTWDFTVKPNDYVKMYCSDSLTDTMRMTCTQLPTPQIKDTLIVYDQTGANLYVNIQE